MRTHASFPVPLNLLANKFGVIALAAESQVASP